MPLFISFLLILAGSLNAQTYPSERIDVYLLAGQSNMAGRGQVGTIDTTAHPRVIALNANGEWVPAREPLHFDKPDIVGVGPGLAFGKRMAEADTTRIIALVPTAVGGTSIDAWRAGERDSATNTHPYDDALARARRATEDGTLRGIIRYQGESDSNPDGVQGYREKLVSLVQKFRSDLDAPNLPFVAGELTKFRLYRTENGRRRKNKPAHAINRAIRRARRDLDRYAVVPPVAETDIGDGTHLDAESSRRFGEEYAVAMQRLLRKGQP